MTLTELRDALAAATKNDFALDIAIECVLFGATERTWDNHVRVQTAERAYNPPNYTASIDAAVTLVPEHMGCRMYLRSAGAVFRPPTGPEIEIAAPTLPLAICRARIEYEIAKEKV